MLGDSDMSERKRVVGAVEITTGTLAGRACTTNIVDASVLEGALRRGDLIVSFDEGDLAAIAAVVALPTLAHARYGAAGYGALLACLAAGGLVGTLAGARAPGTCASRRLSQR